MSCDRKPPSVPSWDRGELRGESPHPCQPPPNCPPRLPLSLIPFRGSIPSQRHNSRASRAPLKAHSPLATTAHSHLPPFSLKWPVQGGEKAI